MALRLRKDLPDFARFALLSVRRMTDEHFRGAGGGRLLAGNALHADLLPESSIGGFFGWFLCSLGQTVGYPCVEGGSGGLTDALVRRLESKGGRVTCGARVDEILVRGGRAVGVRSSAGDVGAGKAVLADVHAVALYLDLLPREHVPARVLNGIRRLELDPATFKVDWALDAPIPWSAPDARRAGRVAPAVRAAGEELARHAVAPPTPAQQALLAARRHAGAARLELRTALADRSGGRQAGPFTAELPSHPALAPPPRGQGPRR